MFESKNRAIGKCRFPAGCKFPEVCFETLLPPPEKVRVKKGG
jgi:hypothetical protein